MTDFDNRPDAKQEAGESLELGQRICRRYGNSPGVARLADAPMVVDRSERFTAQHLPLLGTLQRRWSHSVLMPKGWAAPIYVRPVFPLARVGSPGIGRPAPRVSLRAVSLQPGGNTTRPEPQISSVAQVGKEVGKGREDRPSAPALGKSLNIGSNASVGVSAAFPAEFGPPVFRRRLHKPQISGNRQTGSLYPASAQETGIKRDPANPVVESRPDRIKRKPDAVPEAHQSAGTTQGQAGKVDTGVGGASPEVAIVGSGGHSPETSAPGLAAGFGTEGATETPKIEPGAAQPVDARVEHVGLPDAKFGESAQTGNSGPVEIVQFRAEATPVRASEDTPLDPKPGVMKVEERAASHPDTSTHPETSTKSQGPAEMIQLRPSIKPVNERQTAGGGECCYEWSGMVRRAAIPCVCLTVSRRPADEPCQGRRDQSLPASRRTGN